MDAPCCASCGFRIIAETGDLKDPTALFCGRFPPQVIALPVQTLKGATFAPAQTFPGVSANQRCGEWKAGEPLVNSRAKAKLS